MDTTRVEVPLTEDAENELRTSIAAFILIGLSEVELARLCGRQFFDAVNHLQWSLGLSSVRRPDSSAAYRLANVQAFLKRAAQHGAPEIVIRNVEIVWARLQLETL